MSQKPQGSAAPVPSRLVESAQTADELAMAALLARLPSAAPDDLAVERVWRRVTAAPARPSRRPLLVWIPAVAVVALVLFVWVGRPAKAELALSSGGVFSGKLAEEWRASRSGEKLAEDEHLRTDATGRAVLRMGGVAAVLVREDTDLGLERLHHGTLLRLSRGVVTARVSKRSPDEPFVIETDRYRVRVVGTLFTVEQGPGDHTAVSVREGVVDVSLLHGPGRVDRVLAGQRWVSESVGTRSADATPDAVKTLLEDALAGRSAADLAGPFIAAVTRPGTSVPVAPAVAGSGSPSLGAATVAPTSAGGWHEGSQQDGERQAPEAPVAPARSVRAGDPRGQTVDRTAHADEPAPPAAVEPAPSPPPAPAASEIALPAPSASATTAALGETPDDGPYARGRALEARGDYAGAANAFKRASGGDALHGDLATYALGRVAQRHLHDAARARDAFDLYRARYPHGALIAEVDLAILELEVDAHRDAAALADSQRFLAMHPGSERVDEVRLLRGNLLRDGDRCREALDEYATIRTPPFSDHALYSTAYCQRKLGDRLAAAATLRSYLTRFPNGAHRAEAQQALADE